MLADLIIEEEIIFPKCRFTSALTRETGRDTLHSQRFPRARGESGGA